MKKTLFFITALFLLAPFAHAQDLSIDTSGVRMADDVIAGETVRIYATIGNNSDKDLIGTVKFYDEVAQAFIGEDQPVSVIAGKTDDVFIDWFAGSAGDHNISVRVVPWETEGDLPENNKVTKTLFVDNDSDEDGIGDRKDIDDDNDGVIDEVDYFPLSPYESEDADGDGIGNNGDKDDDNDGVEDIEDAFPYDPEESVDSDHDGTGDNADQFPSDPTETIDSDGDGIGDNSDPNKNNHGPIPQIYTEKEMVAKGRDITFNGIQSRDPDGVITAYEWDFGDGVKKEGVVVEHVFKKIGKHKVVLRTTDDKGEVKEEMLQVSVTYKWQTIALVIITLALLVLIFGYRFIFGGSKKRRRRIEDEMAALHESLQSVRKKKTIVTPKRKKPLPKKSK